VKDCKNYFTKSFLVLIIKHDDEAIIILSAKKASYIQEENPSMMSL